MNFKQLLDLSHEALSGDDVSINAINDVFIDNNLSKIPIPNKKYKQNKFDSFNLDERITEILEKENYVNEFHEWLNAVLVIHEYEESTEKEFSKTFFINWNAEAVGTSRYNIKLSILIESHSLPNGDSIDSISVHYIHHIKQKAIANVIFNIINSHEKTDTNSIYEIFNMRSKYNNQEKADRLCRESLAYLVSYNLIKREGDDYISIATQEEIRGFFDEE